MKPRIVSAPTKVVVFQWPCGTAIRSRSPRGQRPWRRAMLVEAQVSSMKTRCSGSRSGWLSNQSCRRFMTSGQFCSLACADFFERDLVPIEEAPEPSDAAAHAFGLQSGPDLCERDVTVACDDVQDRRAMALEAVRVPVAAQWTGTGIAPKSIWESQIDSIRSKHALTVMGRCLGQRGGLG